MQKTKDLRQVVAFDVPPSVVYKALMDSKIHSKFIGGPAKISKKIGGISNAYGDYIWSMNIELVPDKRIVQAWVGKDWPKGHYSLVYFELAPGKKGTTELSFTQLGIPVDEYAGIKTGWPDFYWKPMKKMFAEMSK